MGPTRERGSVYYLVEWRLRKANVYQELNKCTGLPSRELAFQGESLSPRIPEFDESIRSEWLELQGLQQCMR